MTYINATPQPDYIHCCFCGRPNGVTMHYSDNGGYSLLICYRCIEVITTIIRNIVRDVLEEAPAP